MSTLKHSMMLAFTAVVAAVMTACSANGDNPTPTQAGLPTKFELTGNEVAYASQTNEFAFNMFRTMTDRYQQTSLVTSPLSAACALGMLNNGAVAQTQQELLHVLGFGNADAQAVNEYFYKLMVLAPQVDTATVLSMANAIYVDSHYRVQSAFANALNQYYQAEASSVDFIDPQTLNAINEWCARQTNNMIPKMIEEIPSDALSIILNALYFKGKWQHPFDAKYTRDVDFKLENGQKQRLPMMHMTSEENEYFNTADFQALRMAYGDGHYCMTVLLPSDGHTTSDLVKSLTSGTWSEIQAGLHPQDLAITLPRFTVETSDKQIEDLSDILKQMGAASMFSRDADIPNLIVEHNVCVSQVLQKAKIEVNEVGTEGSAVTAIDFIDSDYGEDSGSGVVAFNASRPFVYIISERTTGLVFFVGAYHGEK